MRRIGKGALGLAWLLAGVLGLTACGGGDSGDGLGSVTPGTAAGTLAVPPGDGVEQEPNHAPGAAQVLCRTDGRCAPPLSVSGRAGQGDADPYRVPGDGTALQDLFRFTASGAMRITLTTALPDGVPPGAADLDLLLLDGAGTTVIGRSEGTGTTTELIETRAADTPAGQSFLLGVGARAGSAAYVLVLEAQGALTSALPGLPAPSAEFVPGEVLVQLGRPGAPSRPALGPLGAVARALASAQGLDVASVSPEGLVRMRAAGRARALSGDPVAARARTQALKAVTLDAVRRLRRAPEVAHAEPNFIARALRTPLDEHFDRQWHYHVVSLPEAWDVTTGAAGVVVAVLDTGVLTTHPDLAPRLVAGWDFVDDDGDPTDPGTGSSHGTHVAGTIGASTSNGTGVAGVTWQGGIMPVRVLRTDGSGTYADIIQGIRFAAGLTTTPPPPVTPARVVNMSLGGTAPSQLLDDAIAEARASGVVLVAAAGNGNTSTPLYPAASPGVISVTAVDLSVQKAPYSNYGPTVDVAAPGGNGSVDLDGDGHPDGVLSTDRSASGAANYQFQQGTSMAASHVAGVIALMLAVNGTLAPDAVDRLLAGTHPETPGRITRDLGAPGRDDLFGHGLIDAARAVIVARSIEGGEGGTLPAGPVLALSSDALDFGNALTALRVDATNAGIGALEVTAVQVPAEAGWLTVTPSAGPAPLSLTFTVDRSGLGDGPYGATVTVRASDGSDATVRVSMRVGGAASGDVGTVYVLLVDPDSLATRHQDVTSRLEGYAFGFSPVAPGTYLLAAGTDRDDDGLVCDLGEACGVFSGLVTMPPGGALAGLDFVVANTGVSETPAPSSARPGRAAGPFRRVSDAGWSLGGVSLRRSLPGRAAGPILSSARGPSRAAR